MATDKSMEIMKFRQQGLGYRRIAAVTGYSLNTVKSVCRRAAEQQEEKVCLQCGAKVEQPPHRKEKKFCSDKCRLAWWKAHPEQLNRKAIYHLVCANCGQSFDSYGNSRRNYCSRACYDAVRCKGVK